MCLTCNVPNVCNVPYNVYVWQVGGGCIISYNTYDPMNAFIIITGACVEVIQMIITGLMVDCKVEEEECSR